MSADPFAIRDTVRAHAPVPIALSNIIILYAIPEKNMLMMLGNMHMPICKISASTDTKLTILPGLCGRYGGWIQLEHKSCSWFESLEKCNDDPLGTLFGYERDSRSRNGSYSPFSDPLIAPMREYIGAIVEKCSKFLLASADDAADMISKNITENYFVSIDN
jgi:hypothetical protein